MDHSHHQHNSQGHIGHPDTPTAPMMMMHAMSFHFSSTETILFDFWKTNGPGEMLMACIATVILALVMETIRFYRAYKRLQHEATQPNVVVDRFKLEPKLSKFELFDGFLLGVQLTLAYSLMLVFMTFNVWLCAAVVVGEVLGRLSYAVLYPHISMGGASSCS